MREVDAEPILFSHPSSYYCAGAIDATGTAADLSARFTLRVVFLLDELPTGAKELHLSMGEVIGQRLCI